MAVDKEKSEEDLVPNYAVCPWIPGRAETESTDPHNLPHRDKLSKHRQGGVAKALKQVAITSHTGLPHSKVHSFHPSAQNRYTSESHPLDKC